MSDQLMPDSDLIEKSGGETYDDLTNLSETDE